MSRITTSTSFLYSHNKIKAKSPPKLDDNKVAPKWFNQDYVATEYDLETPIPLGVLDQQGPNDGAEYSDEMEGMVRTGPVLCL